MMMQRLERQKENDERKNEKKSDSTRDGAMQKAQKLKPEPKWETIKPDQD